MSLITVLLCSGGIVLAADSRSTTVNASGKINQITDDSVKLLPVRGDMGVLTHGIREIGYNGIKALSGAYRNDIGMDTIVTGASAIFLKSDHTWNTKFPRFRRNQGDVGFILAGFDTIVEGKSRIFSFASPGYLPREIKDPYAIEGRWPVARKLAQHLFKRNLSTEAACALAFFLIQATAEKDPSIGGPVQLAIISSKQGYITVGEEQRKIAALHSEKLFRQYNKTCRQSIWNNSSD